MVGVFVRLAGRGVQWAGDGTVIEVPPRKALGSVEMKVDAVIGVVFQMTVYSPSLSAALTSPVTCSLLCHLLPGLCFVSVVVCKLPPG